MGRNSSNTPSSGALALTPTIPLDVQRVFKTMQDRMSQLQGTVTEHGGKLANTVTNDNKSLLNVSSFVRDQLQSNGAFPLLTGANTSGAWQIYLAVLAGTGGMSVVGAAGQQQAVFLQSGPLVSVQLSQSFNIGGSAAHALTISLPVLAYAKVYVPVTGQSNSGAYKPLVAYVEGSLLTVFAGGDDATNWASGLKSISGSFSYRSS